MTIQLKKISNIRFMTTDKIKAKDDQEYMIEFISGRRFKKVNGKVVELGRDKLYADFYRQDEQGCWGNSDFETKIFNKNLLFTTEDILKAINEVSKKRYKDINIID